MVKGRKTTSSSSSSFSSSSKSSLNKSSLNKSSSSNNSSSSRKEPTIEIKENHVCDNDDYNSGFASYLRSPEGSQMMIMFVIANSAMLILTTLWPNIKQLYSLIKESLFEEEYKGLIKTKTIKMLGPLLQGFMLVGVIYLYSKSLLSLINDYYREEFKNELQKDLEKIKEIDKIKANIEKGNEIQNKRDIIIPSPTIEGIPDIFNSPERTSLVINCPDESSLLSSIKENYANKEKLNKIVNDNLMIKTNEIHCNKKKYSTPAIEQETATIASISSSQQTSPYNSRRSSLSSTFSSISDIGDNSKSTTCYHQLLNSAESSFECDGNENDGSYDYNANNDVILKSLPESTLHNHQKQIEEEILCNNNNKNHKNFQILQQHQHKSSNQLNEKNQHSHFVHQIQHKPNHCHNSDSNKNYNDDDDDNDDGNGNNIKTTITTITNSTTTPTLKTNIIKNYKDNENKKSFLPDDNDDENKINEQKEINNNIKKKFFSTSSVSSSTSSSSFDERKKYEIQNSNSNNNINNKDDSKDNSVNNNVCNSRRKSTVSEMIQYWNNQVSLYDEKIGTNTNINNNDKKINSIENSSVHQQNTNSIPTIQHLNNNNNNINGLV